MTRYEHLPIYLSAMTVAIHCEQVVGRGTNRRSRSLRPHGISGRLAGPERYFGTAGERLKLKSSLIMAGVERTVSTPSFMLAGHLFVLNSERGNIPYQCALLKQAYENAWTSQ